MIGPNDHINDPFWILKSQIQALLKSYRDKDSDDFRNETAAHITQIIKKIDGLKGESSQETFDITQSIKKIDDFIDDFIDKSSQEKFKILEDIFETMLFTDTEAFDIGRAFLLLSQQETYRVYMIDKKANDEVTHTPLNMISRGSFATEPFYNETIRSKILCWYLSVNFSCFNHTVCEELKILGKHNENLADELKGKIEQIINNFSNLESPQYGKLTHCTNEIKKVLVAHTWGYSFQSFFEVLDISFRGLLRGIGRAFDYLLTSLSTGKWEPGMDLGKDSATYWITPAESELTKRILINTMSYLQTSPDLGFVKEDKKTLLKSHLF